jgi:hypothetical protein
MALPSPKLKTRNLRTGIILGLLAAIVFFGFIAQSWYLNH